jgi:hypothetical protein
MPQSARLPGQSPFHWIFLGQPERGRRNLSLHNLLEIARGFDIDPAELVRGLQPPNDGAYA